MGRITRGVRLPHLKATENSMTEEFPLPRMLTVSMSQSMGAPCEPAVKKGDAVTVGMKIGDSSAAVSVPVHSPASGRVAEIKEISLFGGKSCKAVVIETDGKQTLCSDIKPPAVTDRESFISAVRESGCCGLGGAGFPTHIKLGFDRDKTPVDILLLNGAECEPYITSDCRELAENPDDVISGARLVMKHLGIPKCLICIEANKPAVIKDMKKRTGNEEGIDIFTLPSSYPQGAEKVLIYTATGRIVQEGELPADRGALVMNVSTAGFIARYMRTGMPLVSRRMTLDGDGIKKNSGNFFVPVGTHVSELLEFTGASDCENVMFGGPMMGVSAASLEQSVTKMNNALLAFDSIPERKVSACIRCGRCIKACPVKLMPLSLEKAYDRRDISELQRLKVKLCINCGCCSYVCPANRRLAEKNQLARLML